jgi:nickel-dependent lactate racemase
VLKSKTNSIKDGFLGFLPTSATEALAGHRPPLGRICIAIPDSTRNINLKVVFEALRQWLPQTTQATVLIGLGLHRPSTQAELSEIQRLSPWPVRDHDPRSCVHFATRSPYPSALPQTVLNADALIAIGVVELHQYAGFSGGHKAFVVGCGGIESIGALHQRDLISHPGVQVGKLQGNPFREHIDQVGEKLPPCIALQWLPDLGWISGEPTATLQAAAQLIQPFSKAENQFMTAVIDVPTTKAVNFYQASRAATYLALSPNPPLLPGAKIILRAACPEGMGLGVGEKNCAAALKSCKPPWKALLSGPFHWGGGAQRAIMLARLAQKYTLLVSDCVQASELRSLGIQASQESAENLVSGKAIYIPNPFKQLPQFGPGPILRP